MKFEIVTIFPDFFRGPLDYGIVRRARETGLIEVALHDLRAFTRDRHRTVDDRPFGGGEGMVLKPEPLFECVESLKIGDMEARRAAGARETVVLLSPQGQMFTQAVAQELAGLERMVLICGRYEGVDERVAEALADREISVGDYVLSGGELGAAVIIDTVTRLLPGALGNEASARQESFTAAQELKAAAGTVSDVPDSTCGSGGLLDYPHYTRPAEFRGMAVPEVLMGGNHEEIRKWRRKKALEKTLRNRPDLLKSESLSKADKKVLAELAAEKEKRGH
ncbi:MAG TPA: tRNA (guanosine(37)-N1)-methyltransferase TrmD [Candidatus Angelobacter sp.]|nr:tRNA (guanosine(37)-N1)-methyltransferase TrmD [Candidatus Angelobacter sp.]